MTGTRLRRQSVTENKAPTDRQGCRTPEPACNPVARAGAVPNPTQREKGQPALASAAPADNAMRCPPSPPLFACRLLPVVLHARLRATPARVSRRSHPMATAQLNRRRLVVAFLAALAAHRAWAIQGQDQKFPDILSVKVRASGSDRFDFDVTVSSPYDTPARYADGFRITSLSGELLGERKLVHDHRDEQPFTRDLHGLRIPRSVRQVVVQGRDQRFGYGGKSVQVRLPGR